MTYQARYVGGGNGAALAIAVAEAREIGGRAYRAKVDGLDCVVVFARKPKSLRQMVMQGDALFTCGTTFGKITGDRDLT